MSAKPAGNRKITKTKKADEGGQSVDRHGIHDLVARLKTAQKAAEDGQLPNWEEIVALAEDVAMAERAKKAAQRVDRRDIAALAARLVETQLASDVPSHGSEDRASLDSAIYDDLFLGAMRRARKLLEGNGDDVHAEQLFDEGQVLTEERICEVFKEVGWPKLGSIVSVRRLLLAAAVWVAEHVHKMEGQMEQHHTGVSEILRFLDTLDCFCSAELLVDGTEAQWPPAVVRVLTAIRWFALEHLKGSLNDCADTPSDWNALMHDLLEMERLAVWCFVGWPPKAIARALKKSLVSNSRPASRARQRAKVIPPEPPAAGNYWASLCGHPGDSTRRYRPCELFRFLRLHAHDNRKAARLLKKLSIKRGDLDENCMPEPLAPAFGAFNAFDGKQREWIREVVSQRLAHEREPEQTHSKEPDSGEPGDPLSTPPANQSKAPPPLRTKSKPIIRTTRTKKGKES